MPVTRYPLALLAAMLALALTAAADHEYCIVTLEDAHAVPTPAGTYYVWDSGCLGKGCLFSLWIFEETNRVEGLQVDNEWFMARGPCYPGFIEPDTIIF